MKSFKWLFWVFGLMFFWGAIQGLLSLYPAYLWFDNLGFSSVFWTSIGAKIFTGLGFGFLFFIIALANILLARFLGRDSRKVEAKKPAFDVKSFIEGVFSEAGFKFDKGEEGPVIDVSPGKEAKNENWLWVLGIFVLSVFFGFSLATQWQTVLKFLNQVAFNISDPIFNLDIGFYVFSFSFLRLIQGFLFSSLILNLFACIWIYFNDGNLSLSKTGINFGKGAKTHLAVLLAVLTLIFAWGLRLGMLEILFSSRGVVFGAGYTDVHAQLLGYQIEIIIAVALAVTFLVSIFQKNIWLPISGILALILASIFFGGVYPSIMQAWQVKPNEITMEAPYIANNIKYTRLAYGLNQIEASEFAAEDNLTAADINKDVETIENIRLWDPRPLIKTYRQLQEIRLYYDFNDVDIDRYQIEGKYRQVMLSARELNVDQIPDKAQTWINRHLKYTHGYGLCLSPVNSKTREGLPEFLIKDIPPVSSIGIKIDRPEIYYGEKTNDYVIVNTKTEEFDYPKGDGNVYTKYKGKGGIRVGSFFRRLMFAIKFSDFKILLTGYITPDSRIMFDRNIRTRVQTIAPFLSFDADPYVVISNGRLYWIQDAYTVTDLFPYSDPFGKGFAAFNYIRNSVKIVINAYDGKMDFYVADNQDPLILTYQKIYPKLFKSLDALDPSLKKHLRYPYDMFMIQALKYGTYHMDDPQVFYNQEDLWNIPKEIYESTEQRMDAYYNIINLRGKGKSEFLLMLPFTPNNKNNMIAWLAARSDGENYGKLVVFKFPKDKLIYGPMQVEARIDQQPQISEQFSLWGQKGSRVNRGNLLAIPINDSLIYVEPIYLEAESGELPELKRVIVAYGSRIAMEPTLREALASVFAGGFRFVEEGGKKVLNTVVDKPKELLNQALRHYQQTEADLQGLKKILDDLSKEINK